MKHYYLYHRISPDMQGTVLCPLTMLKEKYPSVYENEKKKYVSREKIMNRTIPHLNCKWNDVLHLSAVHPKDIDAALKQLGSSLAGRVFVQINPHNLDTEKTIAYTYKDFKHFNTPENWKTFSPEDTRKYSTLPEKTKKYYKKMLTLGKQPLLYHHIPHILYKNTIDISGYSTVSI